MTRAVIEFGRDISDLMPHLSRSIAGSSYDPERETVVFPYRDMTVVMEKNKVTILGADSEEKAREAMGWIAGRVDGGKRWEENTALIRLLKKTG